MRIFIILLDLFMLYVAFTVGGPLEKIQKKKRFSHRLSYVLVLEMLTFGLYLLAIQLNINKDEFTYIIVCLTLFLIPIVIILRVWTRSIIKIVSILLFTKHVRDQDRGLTKADNYWNNQNNFKGD